MTLAQRLVETLPVDIPGLFNPWHDQCPRDAPGNDPQAKLTRLAAHLDCNPKFILCGEAPGYLGCRHSGIAFTSERLLLQGSIPRVDGPTQRLTTRDLPLSEPSATLVWKSLYQLGIQADTVLWNALQMHPHKPNDPHSNRTPTPAELALGAPALRILIDAFPSAKIIAVGKKAEELLRKMNVLPVAVVRHPANGGATKFALGLAEAVQVS